ncbi:MAG: tetratricopeptide repeat protein [Pirellulales bacterium]|nr:tetratricopeptide repeat protein [Pirellulales bacterium]
MYASAVRTLSVLLACFALAPVVHADQADDQFAVAAGHYSAKRWQLAIDEFRTFLREFPENAKRGKAQFFQAEALVQIGKHGDAYPLFVDVLAEDPNGPYAKQALFRAAEAAFMSGRTDEAQVRMSQFQSTYPADSLNAYLITYRADLALRVKNDASAERLYRESLERFADMPTADECRFSLAKLLAKQQQSGEAEKLWREIAKRDHRPWSEMALLNLSNSEAEKKNFQGALELCETFAQRFPASEFLPQSKLSRGRAQYELGRYADARATLSPLMADADLAEDARYWLALTQKAEKKFNEAAETLHGAVEATDKKAKSTLAPSDSGTGKTKALTPNIADKLINDKPTTEKTAVKKSAGEQLESAADRQRRRAAAMRYHAADSLIRAGEFTRAIEALKAGVHTGDDPTTLSTRYLLAIALQGIGKHDEASQTLRQLDADIDHALEARVVSELTVNTSELKRLDSTHPHEAAADDRGKVPDNTTDSKRSAVSAEDRETLVTLRNNSRLALATSLIALEKSNDAIEPLQAYLASGRQDASAQRARSALAICLARTQRIEAAKLMLDELKSRHPDSKMLLTTTHHVAEAAYAAGQYQAAYDLFSQLAAQGNPAELIAAGLAGMGWSRQQLGEFETAAEIFGEFLQLFPADARAADVTLARGQAWEKIGKNDAALALYKQSLGRFRQSPQLPQILFAAAKLCDHLGQDDEAVSLYQRFVREFPQASDADAAIYGWAWALRDLGRGNDSDKVFRQLRDEFPSSRFWPDASFRLAERAAQRGDSEQAAALLKPLLEGQCTPAVQQHALYLSAQIEIAELRWKQAEEPLRRLIQEHPDSSLRLPAEFWYAEVAYRATDYTAAKYRFDTIAQHIGGQTDTWVAMVPLRRAQMMLQRQEWPKARDLAESIARDFPDFDQQFEADYVIGRCLAAEADFDGARGMYQRVVRSPGGGKTETAAMAQFMIGESHFHQEKYDEALREYLRVEILYPYPRWQAAALLQAGKCHEKLGHSKEAAELYTHLKSKHPDSEFVAEANERLQSIANRPTPPASDQVGELKSVLRRKITQ